MKQDQKKIESMKMAGRILGEVMEKLLHAAKPGTTEVDIDKLAERLILEKGAEEGFKKVPGYKHAICISVNNVVVHGVPKMVALKRGDIVGIDCGVYFNGYHTDMAETIMVEESVGAGSQINNLHKFIEVGKKALFAGIKQAKAGNRVGHISCAIQEIVEGSGYSVVRNLVGHGIGKKLHEKPEIPGFIDTKIEKTQLLTLGMTIAIEVIYNMGKPDVDYQGNDDWTIVTEDGSISGLFERTILITESGSELLTTLATDVVVD